jgi:predicted site-specific integrase-resolvase
VATHQSTPHLDNHSELSRNAKKAAIYARVSTGNGQQDPEMQIGLCSRQFPLFRTFALCHVCVFVRV